MDSATLNADLGKAQVFGKAVISASSLLPGFIAGAEALLPASGSGVQKLEMVKNWIEGALAWEGHEAAVIEALWPKLLPVIEILVKLAKIA